MIKFFIVLTARIYLVSEFRIVAPNNSDLETRLLAGMVFIN
jgi:hypothetical protein